MATERPDMQASRLARSTDHSDPPIEEHPKSGQGDNVPNFRFVRPKRLSPTRSNLYGAVRTGFRTFWHLVTHTIALFSPAPNSERQITATEPEGKISSDQLPLCESIARRSEVRLERLERKSTTLLSAVAVVAPLAGSAALFVATETTSTELRVITLGMSTLAALFLLLSFVALLRALGIKNQQSIFIGAVIDQNTASIREYEADRVGRGLLWEATHREALSDHIADFVRAGQLFLVLGISCAVLGSAPAMYFATNDSEEINAQVRIDSLATSPVEPAEGIRTIPVLMRLERIEKRLDSLTQSRVESNATENSKVTGRDSTTP